MVNFNINPVLYPISPSHLACNHRYEGTFADEEVNSSADWLIWFSQQRGGWFPFTRHEIDVFYNNHYEYGGPRLLLDKMVAKDYVALVSRLYYVTHKFVSACFAALPDSHVR